MNIVNIVRKVNRQAGLIIKRKLSLMAKRGQLGPHKTLYNGELNESFTWFETPQGHDYWWDIDLKIRDMEGYFK